MALIRTLDFLPEIFRTDPNRKFFNATMDQLIAEPNFKKINGYIGRVFAPTYKSSDNYVTEISPERQHYQLEPSVVVSDTTNQIQSFSSYSDLIQQIQYYTGVVTDHSRLFNNESYSFNGLIDFDKLVNFNQYYWLPNGPSPVDIYSGAVDDTKSFAVTRNTMVDAYMLTGFGAAENPDIILARGGSYQFIVNQPGNKLWIQTAPGLSGTLKGQNNISTRDVFGVSNNGLDNGIITFNVPQTYDQEYFVNMPLVQTVDYATQASFIEIDNQLVENVAKQLGGIDSVSTNLAGKYLIFVANDITDKSWDEKGIYAHGTWAAEPYDSGKLVTADQRYGIWQIQIEDTGDGDQLINLVWIRDIPISHKVFVTAGKQFANVEFYRKDVDLIERVPLITAPLDTLYYSDGTDSHFFGRIRLVDKLNFKIDVASEILGKKSYVSPNGVIFTNGLKVIFDTMVTDPSYADNTYYVEGVGKSIRLVAVDDLITPELDIGVSSVPFDIYGYAVDKFDQILNGPLAADYITINRSSIDGNAWSRGNRWFHEDVIAYAASVNKEILQLQQTARASRPIIEFDPDIRLFNYGKIAYHKVDILDFTITDALTQVEGNVGPYFADAALHDGMTVIFANDFDPIVKNRVFTIRVLDINGELKCHLVPNNDIIDEFDSVVPRAGTMVPLLPFNGDPDLLYNPSSRRISNVPGIPPNIELSGVISENVGVIQGDVFWFNGTNWVRAQQKTDINIPPRFDLVDNDGISFSDNNYYVNSSFTGLKIFSYSDSTGKVDPILGFPLKYRNFNNVGDIEFSNNIDIESFSYLQGLTVKQVKMNTGFITKTITRDATLKLSVWDTKIEPSKQYQIISNTFDGTSSYFEIDILPEQSKLIPNLKVFVNSKLLNESFYYITDIGIRKAIHIPEILQVNDQIDILIFSKNTSKLGYYEIPDNLEFNALNAPFTQLTLGQFRNHLTTIADNSNEISGLVPGSSNLRDLDIKSNGGSIMQHSAPTVYSSLFLTNTNVNFIDSITLSQHEYTRFKNRFLELYVSVVNAGITNAVLGVDYIMRQLTSFKNKTSPWYYSDMIPFDANRSIITYSVLNQQINEYEIDQIFNDNILSNTAILVYLDGEQLTKGIDYTFNQSRPSIIFNNVLSYDSQIEIVTFNNTDGCFVPETPTKLGLYPKFKPEIYVDTTYSSPITVIRGHDGSITPTFGDIRDRLLLELELRIYNNIKISYDTTLFDVYSHIPGKFRDTDYAKSEFDQALSRCFLNWTGSNRLNFSANQWFESNNAWTWTYKRFKDTVDGEFLPGYWRGVYKYFYDTDFPNYHPWEMLGFSEMPHWWISTYGEAPYTGGNLVLWNDLALGRIRHGDRAGIDPNYARPGLLKIIPVTETGELRSPDQFLVKSFNSNDASGSFGIGDEGPVETAWRRSSDYPFALQQAIALTKPGVYFGQLINVNLYNRHKDTNQFVVATTNQRLTPNDIQIQGNIVNGQIVRAAGYLNWIVDYLASNSLNPSQILTAYFTNLDVRLGYKAAGFTDKAYLKVLAEQSSPTSTNESIIIPDENYQIILHKSTPVDRIVYSAVIIEKTTAGFTVSGYDLNTPFFIIIPSEPSSNQISVTVNNVTGIIYNDYRSIKLTVPYGYEFRNRQQVVDFLTSYGRYLRSQGFTFDDYAPEMQSMQNWELAVKEFLTWSQQGWAPGNILVLSPVSNSLKVKYSDAVVDEVSNIPAGSKILDVSFNVIKSNLFNVVRDDTEFSITTNSEITIGLADLSLVQYEHALVFDNKTVFNDIIYKPELGNRQYRLKMIGNKTNEWAGQVNPPGFIYSNPIINNWATGTDYRKGDLVKFKSMNYTALQNVDASESFNMSYWKQVDKKSIRAGLLPNFAYNASKFENMYDVDNQIQDQNINMFGNGLIGYRERNFLVDLSLNSTSQAKFYQGYIRDKGTKDSISALSSATFNNLTGNLSYFEEWAFRIGEYGAIESNQFIEIQLTDDKYTHDPVTCTLLNSGELNLESGVVSEYRETLYKKPISFKSNIFDNRTDNSDYDNDILTAGYVNLQDIDATIFDITAYQDLSVLVNTIYSGYKIWVAKDTAKDWNVYRIDELPAIMISMSYALDNFATCKTSLPHNLAAGDIFVVRNFYENVDGFYSVANVVDMFTITVSITNTVENIMLTVPSLSGTGAIFKLSSLRFNSITDVAKYSPESGWKDTDKIWVDRNADNKWTVYDKAFPWKFNTELPGYVDTTDSHYGQCVKCSADGGIIVATSPGSISNNIKLLIRTASGIYYENAGIIVPHNDTITVGNAIALNDDSIIVSAENYSDIQSSVLVYNLNRSSLLLDVTKSEEVYDTSGIMIHEILLTNAGSGYTQKPYVVAVNQNYLSTNGSTLDTGYGIQVDLQGSLDNGIYTITGLTVQSTGHDFMVPPVLEVHSVDGNGSGAVLELTYIKGGFGSSIAISNDNKWLYIGAPTVGKVQCYAKNNVTHKWVFIDNLVGLPFVQFGTAITTNEDGSLIIVGASHNSAGGFPESGETYVYKRINSTFTLIQTISLSNANIYDHFGTALCLSGDELFIGAPGKADALYKRGVVYRYKNEADQFNLIQTITKPFSETEEQFGTAIIKNELTNSLMIASEGAYSYNATIVDSVEFTLDSSSTTINDNIRNAGAVYVYDLLGTTNTTYCYSQQLKDAGITTGDNFGKALAAYGNNVIVGSPKNDRHGDNAGKLMLFTNEKSISGWNIIRTEDDKVDLSKVNKIYVYDRKNQNILANLDYIDPAKGKILGMADEDIAYKTAYDPASYSNGTNKKVTVDTNFYWGAKQVGQVWWNLDAIRYIDYEQDSLTYRSKHWGQLFPGSLVQVLEWVENDYLPSAYSGEGTPLYPDNSAYVQQATIDSNTGTVKIRYYYWVMNKSTFDANLPFRRLSLVALTNLIYSPSSQNIPYAAILKDNSISLFNTKSFISADNAILHIDYALLQNTNIIHNEYELVQENSDNAILPNKIVNKLIDSLTGADSFGNVVPDYTLGASERYGITIRPRQTMIVDRLTAIENFVQYVNTIFLQSPIVSEFDLTGLMLAEPVPLGWDPFNKNVTVNSIVEIDYLDRNQLEGTWVLKNPSNPADTSTKWIGQCILVTADITFDNRWAIYEINADNSFTVKQVQGYRTTDYWHTVNWYHPSYDPTVKPTYTINSEKDLAKLTLVSEDIVHIKNDGTGRFIVYRVNADLTKTLVGLQAGTIQLKDSLWAHDTNQIGFSNDNFDSVLFDLNPTVEFRNIINAIKNDIFVKTLDGQFNKLFFVILDYILSEQITVDWAFKTSFISIIHKLRKLEQFPNYIKDNQSYYEDYINEIKPYRTQIREYVINYEGDDIAYTYATDFDLPSYYDTDFNSWRSPNGEHARDDLLLSIRPEYSDWLQHHSYIIESVVVEDAGYGYSAVPVLEIVGGGGTGAKLEAVLDYYSGSITKINVISSGTGFISTPTIRVWGDGIDSNTGMQTLKCYPMLSNSTIRSFDVTLKFDRISYSSDIVKWAPYTEYNENAIVSYNNTAYSVKKQLTTLAYFDPEEYVRVDDASLTSANDRVAAFYNPSIGMTPADPAQLFDRVEYPGVKVDGVNYVTSQNVELDSSIQSSYSDLELGTRPEDIIIDGGAYIDTYSSHAPEELFPGLIYDTLDIKVFTIQFDDPTNNPIGFRISKTLIDETKYTNAFSFHRISAAATTELARPLNITDTEIFVTDVSKLPVPDPKLIHAGVIMINGEKITYYTVNTMTNSLGQIRRGVWGTGAPLVHNVGTLVVDASVDQQIPNSVDLVTGLPILVENTMWLNPGFGTLFDGNGLYASNTTQARFLRAEASYLPWVPGETGIQIDPNAHRTRFDDDGTGQINTPVHPYDIDPYDSYEAG